MESAPEEALSSLISAQAKHLQFWDVWVDDFRYKYPDTTSDIRDTLFARTEIDKYLKLYSSSPKDYKLPRLEKTSEFILFAFLRDRNIKLIETEFNYLSEELKNLPEDVCASFPKTLRPSQRVAFD